MKYKKGKLLEEYFLNPNFEPTPKEEKELEDFFIGLRNKNKKREFKLND